MIKLINPKNLQLSTSVVQLLTLMFNAAEEVLVESELKPGSGDSFIFVVQAKANNSIEYLIVKIASASLIRKEWNAYQQYIPKKLRGITEIRDSPIYLPLGNMGALAYPLIGNKEYKVESLLNYCKNVESHNIIHDVFEDEFFENLQFLWGRGELYSNYTYLEHYSHLLPYYLIVEENLHPSERIPIDADLNLIFNSTFNHGDCVSVFNGRVSSIYHNENAIAIKPLDNDLGSRILWKPVNRISLYQVDDVIKNPLIGIVQKNQYQQIVEYAQTILHQPFDPTSQSIQVSNNLTIPNPIAYLNSILRKTVNVRFACIHGDLNLENILVEYYEHPVSGFNHIAHLVDFDNSRRDHVLRDILKLETEIMTRILPDLLAEANLPLELVNVFYKELHNAVISGAHNFPYQFLQKPFEMIMSLRKLARYYLFNPEDWTEYYYGLVIYLIGSFKFRNLDKAPLAPLPKSIAFLGAGTTISLLLEVTNL